jgi:hypothetical protein
MIRNGWTGGQRVDSTRQSMCSTQVDRTLGVHLCPRVRSNEPRVDKKAGGIETPAVLAYRSRPSSLALRGHLPLC